MNGELASRYADTIISHSRLVIVLLLVLTAAIAAGAVFGESKEEDLNEFDVESEETAALEEIEETYETDEEIITQIVVRDEGGDVLTRDSLLESLRLQQDVRENESLNATLTEDGFIGLENTVGTAAVFEDRASEEPGEFTTELPTLDEKQDALETRSDDEVDALLADILDPESDQQGEDPTEFLPTDYDVGTTTAESRITFAFQTAESESDEEPTAAYDAQLEIESLFNDRFDDGFVFSEGIVNDASASAVGDSFAIITPVALILVLVVLGVTFRDTVDVLLGLFGIGIVMACLAGIQGWLGISSNSMLIAVPFLLIGLSIDYSLHVVMRYREARAETTGKTAVETSSGRQSPRTGMALGLAGVVLALAAATFSTGIGFLSNILSPMPAIQDFAVLSAGGILATFVVFGALVPALKSEVDDLLETRFGHDRAKTPFGTGTGPVNRVLSSVVALVRKAPFGVVAVAFLLATAGAYGAMGLDTEFNQTDFLPEDSPDWAKSLPGPLATDTYTVTDDVEYLGEHFQDRSADSQSQILIRGDVTDPAVLSATTEASMNAEGGGTINVRADGTAGIEGPASVLNDVADENETVANAIEARDTNGDGLPDKDLEGLYDLLYDVESAQAETVLYRTDSGEYESARLLLSVRSDAAAQDVADDTEAVATAIESNAPVSAIATGGPVTTAIVQDALLETLIQAFTATVGVILVFLTVLYWIRHRALSLGAITLAPVVAAVAWLLGTMAILEIPFNTETVVMTSLAIGLGVDYSIHVSERFITEREQQEALTDALSATVLGTGGALLGSAATTAAGFGVLALALSPPLQRFGLVTGLSIIFAFTACLTLLPCLLVAREQLLTRVT